MGCSSSQDDLLLKIEALSPKDKEILKKSWSLIPNKEELGNQIMFRIFKTHDEIKYLWIFASNLETESEMLRNSQFCYHAKRLADSLDMIVAALISPTPVVDFSNYIDVFRLGKRHWHYGVQAAYYECFAECLFYALKKCTSDQEFFTSDVRRVWKNAIDIMFQHFGSGLLSEEKEMKNQDKLRTKLKRNSQLY